MSRWFRLYDDVLDDPKVQRLAPVLFKAWINLLCLASRNSGALPSVDDIAFALRTDIETMNAQIDDLVARGLIDEDGDAITPHNWKARQFRSDRDETAAERQARKRSRDKENSNAHVTRDITPPRADTDTKTDTVTLPSASASDLDGLEAKCRQAANAENNPSPSLFDLSHVIRCLNAGASLELDVLPTIRQITVRGHHWSSWKYAERAIMNAKASREAPAAIGQAPNARGQPPPRPSNNRRILDALMPSDTPDAEFATSHTGTMQISTSRPVLDVLDGGQRRTV
jgi:hypothetical protein